MLPPKAKKAKISYDPVEEARLERLVFGDSKDVLENLLDKTTPSSQAQGTDDPEEAEENTGEHEDADSDSLSTKSDDELSDSESKTDEIYAVDSDDKIKPAWVDDDDEKYSIDDALAVQQRRLPPGRLEKNYKELLDKKFTQLVGTPKWAEIKTDNGELSDEDTDLLKHSNHIVPSDSKKLPRGIIDLKALKDINQETHNEGPIITSLQFHPTSTVAFVAGLAGIVSVFQIDGRENTKLQSIKFDKFPINTASFLREGNEILLASRRRKYSQIYDLISGKVYKCELPHDVTSMQKFQVSPDGNLLAVPGQFGEVYLLSSKSKELIDTLKMNRKCRALAFTPDSKTLITHGESEEIYFWDVNSRSCINRAIDDGCISSGAVAVSPNNQFLATGSKQGVVNIYDINSVKKERIPKPLKIILNLVTPITSLKFNPTSEILALASEFKENAFKMVHLPSFNVFSNFPTFRTVIHNPIAIDFSPASGYLAVSNNKNNAYLYRLKHYGNY